MSRAMREPFLMVNAMARGCSNLLVEVSMRVSSKMTISVAKASLNLPILLPPIRATSKRANLMVKDL